MSKETQQLIWLLAIAIGCNRTDDQMEHKVVELICGPGACASPFDTVKLFAYEKPDGLVEQLTLAGISPAARIAKTFYNSACNPRLILGLSDPDRYTGFSGITPYMARLYIRNVDITAPVALLTPSVLVYLQERAVEKVPATTPSTVKAYSRLENEFLRIAAIHQKTPQELETMVEYHTNR